MYCYACIRSSSPLEMKINLLYIYIMIFTPQPFWLNCYYLTAPGRASGPAAGSRFCRAHISETAGWIFSIQSFMEFSRPEVVQHHGHFLICLIWANPWAKNSSNPAPVGSGLNGTHISETVGQIHSVQSSMEFSRPVTSSFAPHGLLSYGPKTCQIWYEVLWNCLNL